MSEERRKEYEKNFAKYAIKTHADSRYSITGKRLSSILLQTGVDVYTVQQIMTIINKSDESQVLVEDFLAASALIDRATEGYRLPDISRLYLIRDELFKNIQYKQHIFDPRYCLSWFYHRDMKFETADGILKMPGRRDGSFLVWRRKNDDFYSLGTIFGHGSFHLRIDITAGMYSVERNVKFPQLGRLIQHYMAHPLPIPGDWRLKYPIPVHTPSTKRWFYPNISPVSAILLLRIFSSEQNFIVRYSVETPGCFALVLRTPVETISFKIIHKHGFYCLQGGEDTAERFRNLDALIEYYNKNPIYSNAWGNPIYCQSFTLKHSTPPFVPVCAQHPKVPLVVGKTEDELLCMECSEKVDRYFIEKGKLAEFREIFGRLDSENFSIGLQTENNVKSLLRDKGVLEDAVSRIWELADLDRDKFLNEDEFCIAMYLAELALAKKMLPQGKNIPPSLIPPFDAI
ncbi:uncharacterized protein LOC117321282, partial [Pecten maximus]|uniref:uncharacterized protein LOC117321282 n=1 Tax=Pecten maximus TaxID=6579 RepID=UPI0014589F3F